MRLRQPCGVQGRKPVARSPVATLPSLVVFSPSTSLAADTASVTRCESISSVVSSGICTMMPCTLVSSFSSRILLSSWVWVVLRSSFRQDAEMPICSAALIFILM